MRKLTVLIVSLLIAVPAMAQTVDFTFRSEVDAAYEAYVDSMQAVFEAAIDTIGDSTSMWGHMGLVVAAIANIHIQGDHMVGDIEDVVDDLESQMDSIDLLVDSIITLDGDDLVPFLQSLTEHFLDPKYTRIKELTDGPSRQAMKDVDSLQGLVEDYAEIIQDFFIQLEDNAEALIAGSTFVEFTYQVDDDSAITVDTAIVSQLDDIIDISNGAAEELGGAIEAMMEAGESSDSAVIKLQDATGHLNALADSIDALCTVELLDSMGLSSEFTDDIRDVLDDADSVLAGEEFEIDGDDSTRTIRPVAILENMDADWGGELEQLFRSDMPETLTFFGLFPNGLPQSWIDGLAVNMIIDVHANEAQVDSYFAVKQAEFEAVLDADPMDGVAHTGLGIIKTWQLIQNHNDEIDEMVDFLDRGLIDSLTANHTWQSIDYTAETDEIQAHFDAAQEDNGLLFVILYKEGPYGMPVSFELSDEDEIQGVLPLPDEIISLGADIIAGFVEARDDIAAELQDFFDEMHTYMDMELDPNVMDFSQTEEDTEVVDILIAANSNFLNITPAGNQWMLDKGDEIRNQLAKMADATAELKNLLNAVATRHDDLDIDSTEFATFGHELDSMVNELKMDFDTPGYTMNIDGERVNLSAWFDNPPDSLIYRIRASMDEDSLSDNTIGGLFPDRGVGNYLTGITRPWLKYRPLKSVVKHVNGNPVQSRLTLRVEVSKQAPVSVAFTDAAGQIVRTMDEGMQPAGTRDFSYTLEGMHPGQYFVTVIVGSAVTAYKLVLVK